MPLLIKYVFLKVAVVITAFFGLVEQTDDGRDKACCVQREVEPVNLSHTHHPLSGGKADNRQPYRNYSRIFSDCKEIYS